MILDSLLFFSSLLQYLSVYRFNCSILSCLLWTSSVKKNNQPLEPIDQPVGLSINQIHPRCTVDNSSLLRCPQRHRRASESFNNFFFSPPPRPPSCIPPPINTVGNPLTVPTSPPPPPPPLHTPGNCDQPSSSGELPAG